MAKKQNLFAAKHLSRRDFLKVAGVGVAGLVAASCKTQPESVTASRAEALHTVAIAKAQNYIPAELSTKIGELLENIGGLDDVIRPGDSVALKVNLTGGTYFEAYPGVSAIDSYVTHPQVTLALGKHLLEAGARQIYIVEALYDADSYSRWGYAEVADALGATLIDLNDPAPFTDFADLPVGADWGIYQSLKLNRLLNEVAVFVSISKMKCHYSVGVTHTMKNLVGITPVQHYRLNPEHFWRSALHGDDYGPERLPRVIVDINRARPIHLALVDGIKAAEGGEVPRGSFRPVEPGVLIAGKNSVATDAIATAVMGFNPVIQYPAAPFLHGENYLNSAREFGLGSNRLAEIHVAGHSIDEVRFNFAASTKQAHIDSQMLRVM